MRVKIIKSLLSIYGAMVPGKEIDVPDRIGRNWISNKIAVAVSEVRAMKGMFWCAEHRKLHRLTSPQGKKCLKRIERERAAEAEELARQEAETMKAEATKPQLTEQANDLNAKGASAGAEGEGGVPPAVIDPQLREE